MKLKPLVMAVAVASGVLSLSANAGVVKTDGEDIIVSTKGGLKLKTADGQFSFKISGKLQWDYASYSDLYAGIDKSDSKGRKGYIRRAEIGFSGKAYSTWKYKLKLKGTEEIELGDAKITYTGFKPVSITAGRWGRDYGLENTTSSSWIMGIERPMIYDALNGDEGNTYGIEAATSGDNYTAVIGLHNDGEADSANSDEERLASFIFRGTFAPVMEDNMLVHLGFNYYSRNPDAKSDQTIKTRLGLKKADKLSLMTVANVDSDSEYVLEGAVQFEGLQLQGEYAVRNLDSASSSNGKVTGYYGQASFMLDGGKRGYKGGAFSKPKGGKLEAFVRYSNLKADLSNSGDDAEVRSYTLGMNYFPTKNIRASLNYVSGKINADVAADEDDKGTALVGRLQYVF